MLTSITLQNFKSFGEKQTIPLQPLTVLVGPNNSGKSNLVSLARFIRNAATGGAEVAFEEEGGIDFVFHRPPTDDGVMRLGWEVDEGTDAEGTYSAELERGSPTSIAVRNGERFDLPRLGKDWAGLEGGIAFIKLRALVNGPGAFKLPPDAQSFRPICLPIVASREIKLALASLRADAELVPTPRLGDDGSNLPTVLGLWRGSDPERAEALQEFVRSCLPEVKHVLVKPSPTPGYQRLWVQQEDGLQLDAEHMSDGVLYFVALAMHTIEAEPGSLIFIEEPEQAIHPRRIRDIVELFRTVVHEHKSQVVVVTHSPVLLHEFKDEPEAIVLFRRDEKKGTRVNSLTDFPDLIEALRTKKADPGDMLVDGFLNAPS